MPFGVNLMRSQVLYRAAQDPNDVYSTVVWSANACAAELDLDE